MSQPATTHEPRSYSNPSPAGGEQAKYRFPNGYGASVIRGLYTYGGVSGLWEIAVLGPDGDLDYSTPVTNDVIGYLSDDEVQGVLDQIEALPMAGA